MKDRRITIVATCMVVLFAPAAVAQTINKFSEQISQSWHVFENWSLLHVPNLSEVALIKAGNICKITDPDNGGKAQSVTVESGATLGVDLSGGEPSFLHLRPTGPSYIALTVDGTLYFKGFYTPVEKRARLVLEIDDSDMGIAAVLSGSGLITAASAAFYGPAVVVRADTGPLDFVWGIEVAPGLTMKGEWVIPMSTDNDGLMLVDGADTMDFTSPINCSGGPAVPLTEKKGVRMILRPSIIHPDTFVPLFS